MKTPIYVRDLTIEEQEWLRTGLRSKDRFELRRSQIVQASARMSAACAGNTPEFTTGFTHSSGKKDVAVIAPLTASNPLRKSIRLICFDDTQIS